MTWRASEDPLRGAATSTARSIGSRTWIGVLLEMPLPFLRVVCPGLPGNIRLPFPAHRPSSPAIYLPTRYSAPPRRRPASSPTTPGAPPPSARTRTGPAGRTIVPLQLLRQVLLRQVGVRRVVGVLVARCRSPAPSSARWARSGCGAAPARRACLARRLERRAQRGHGAVRLGRRREVDRHLRQRQIALGRSEHVEGVARGDRHAPARSGRPGRCPPPPSRSRAGRASSGPRRRRSSAPSSRARPAGRSPAATCGRRRAG